MNNHAVPEQMFVLASHPTRGLEFICVDVQPEIGLMQFHDKSTNAFAQAAARGYLAIAAFALDDPAGKQVLGLSTIPGLTKIGSEGPIDQQQNNPPLFQRGVSPDQCQIQMLQSETLIEASNNLKHSDSEQKISNYGTQFQNPK